MLWVVWILWLGFSSLLVDWCGGVCLDLVEMCWLLWAALVGSSVVVLLLAMWATCVGFWCVLFNSVVIWILYGTAC